ncbi:MAG: hypothetical protein ACKOPE_08195 [Novosphingobium sp.]
MDISTGSRAIVAAIVLERFVDQFDFARLTASERDAALREIRAIAPQIAGRNTRLDQALRRFEAGLCASHALGRRSGGQTRRLQRVLRWLMPLALGAATAGGLAASPAYAYTTPAVNSAVFNPLTQANETVVEIIGSGYAVRTNQDNIIFLATAVNDTYSTTVNGVTTTYTVTAVTTTTYGSGPSAVTYVTGVTVKDNNNVSSTTSVVTPISYTVPSAGGGSGSGSTTPVFPVPSGNEQYQDIRVGNNGGNGRDGGGIQICVPFLGCATIGVDPTAGGAGAPGPNFTSTVPANYSGALIASSADNLPGIKIASIGGNGGAGGDGYVAVPGAAGGAAGNGGNVTGINYSEVSTSGDKSYGMWVFSQAGQGGAGGTGYVFGGGGGGGSAASGGSARGENYATITTQGKGAVGLLVQSLGGGGGTGGSSYGVVGSSGSGSFGGNGGSATAYNAGTILTGGEFAHGVQAQSIGGNGGNSGDSGGLVAFGGGAGGAGTGGNATVTLTSSSVITTTGKYAHGVFSQSIGGGGGSTGWTGGAASFGGSAASGGTGGAATVTADAGSRIETFNIGSYGIFAESVGGNGGTAGGSGGLDLFTMGGSGGSGNTGGAVNVTSSATIITHGADARGVFAQSVGGGGGNANVSGGLVSLGGSGGTGANGGTATVTLGAASWISTLGKGADGVYAQSVGGGGGAGGAASGLVALGGSGSVGGQGGTVNVSNAGTIVTDGTFSRGLFAQSVGGGGGSGGDGDGLVAIGGEGSVASNGGTVTATNSGSITTTKNRSTAMQVQSIGGGGGDGGTSGGVLLTIGGTGGGGGLGGLVTANLSGSLETSGNDSHGLLAQSVGGGGGNGGASISTSAFAGFALGGKGGGGGAGGNVTANFTQRSIDIGGNPTLLNPLITTTGDRSRGVFLQSVGGGGGSGGMAVQVTAGFMGAVSLAVGGKGGDGGAGGLVTANGDVVITTTGDNSEGYFAQSVGGGGGNGGASISVAASVGLGASASLSMSVGGSGGLASNGGTVDVTSGGGITTSGAYSTGFVAQSVGGGGGKGGYSISVAGAASDGTALAGAFGIGGSGGDGGNGGSATAAFNGNIATGGLFGLGHDSVGALIQSVGGGGGSGGYNVSATLSLAVGPAFGGSLGLGGSGGKGGTGGTVNGTVGGTVQTYGQRSTGVVIQSVGGGGGSGGYNVSGNITGSTGLAGNVGVGLGGSGGEGGSSGAVFGTVNAAVETYGFQSDGVVIQSVGGGGGSGGFNVTGSISFSGTSAVSLGFGLGGSGGVAGNGGSVNGTVSETVTTHNNQSRGILVQSVGGGGGAGGFNVTGGLSAGGTAGLPIGVGLGGAGGSGGDSGAVIASVRSVLTNGDDSGGFIAQSVGGGGGIGGFNIAGGLGFGGTTGGAISIGLGGSGGSGGSSGTVSADLTGSAITTGDRSTAVLAQSVGGGGGSGSFNVSGGIAGGGEGAGSMAIGLGGSGAKAGNATDVALTIIGRAETGGLQSAGIVAQSVGGGGGNGAFNISGAISAAGTGAPQATFGMGGHGGAGGNAGSVVLNVNNSTIASDPGLVAAITRKDFSDGIIAQSLGGGGGNGGFNVNGGVSLAGEGAGGVNVGVGGSGGGGGFALDATADLSGKVSTTGNDSNGVLTQSIGGGGGNGGFSIAGALTISGSGAGTVNVGVGGAGGNGGRSGNAELRINDQVAVPGQNLVAAETLGARSAGLVAQSIGGGGGNGGFNVTAGINIGITGAGGANIGIGGMGGDGGNAGSATANITGGVSTASMQSNGIVVQSIGGGGGNGGFNVSGTISVGESSGSVGVGVGGFGGKGGTAGVARLNLNQRTDDSANTLVAVTTVSDDSNAVIVQSLGGGGGNGGFNVTGNMSFAKGGAGNLGIGVGGFGGGGGEAAEAYANIRGNINTSGNRSNAVLVQSLGGGGGNGGFNVTAGITGSKAGNGNIGFGIGGFGGDGGSARAVFATVQSDIVTVGNNSYGASIQSIGGGGGNGGFNVTGGVSLTAGTAASGNVGVGIGGFGGKGGAGDAVTASFTGDIRTYGYDSHGLLVQSQGGGGGNGGFNVTGGISVSKGANGSMGVGIGGFGGDGGNAGAVIADMFGDIETTYGGSYGVTIQSLGGGGGNGAFNVTGGVNMAFGTGTTGNLNVGVGGFGGGGGDAGAVTGTVIGNVTTVGDSAHGVLVQSLGGGGGNGGMNISGGIAFTKSTSGSIGFGLGGFGGDGGDGGVVKATLNGNVWTNGNTSYGAILISQGGAGGNGAVNITGTVAISKGDATSGSVAMGVGGFGGGGGNGKSVNASVTGYYETDGVVSPGVVAMSLGGGGGDGGVNISGTVALSTAGTAFGVSLGLGGFGGLGGNAGDVTLVRSGTTQTWQRNSDGVYVGSIGGGGGRGGVNISGGIAGTNEGKAGTISVGVGGFAGGGGNSGIVNATITDSVWAKGSDAPINLLPLPFVIDDGYVKLGWTKSHWGNGSNGIVVKSQGGGGGSGGVNIAGGISLAKASDSTASALVLGFGGFGGSGGNAESVTATIGTPGGYPIEVEGIGDTKAAVYIGSVGGGGGDGALNISGGITSDGQITAGFGGAGGGGGLGRDVNATVNANLFVTGFKAKGLVAQSVGGGGGSGGINISGGLKPMSGNQPVITFGMGGDGGAGNSSGNVTVNQDGQVMVTGFDSRGIIVQSVAGGGGAGGLDIVADVNRSSGESKIDGFAAGIGIGGTGGQGSVAGDVYLRSTGNVLVNTVVTTVAGVSTLTAGPEAGFSQGVTVQSIGGGGGSGGFNFVGVVAPKGNPLTFAMGGSGGVGGDAGNVTVRRGYKPDGTVSKALISTFDAGSAGLVAQSIGGGGGSAGTNLAFTFASTEPDKSGFVGEFIIGGDGGSSGNGKVVNVDHAGNIATDGYGSDGIVAQSIGKGGGNAAVNIGLAKVGGAADKSSTVNGFSLALGGAPGNAGSAGDVTVNHDGVITTRKASSSGLVAQSLAGGGGNVALNMGPLLGADNALKISIGREGGNGGISGIVNVSAAGQINVAGEFSNGIVAQSVGGAGGMSGTISVDAAATSGSGTDKTQNGASVSVGLAGASGGHSEAVTVNNLADISTDGKSARGIVAQSIGGDGGMAGSAQTLTTGQANSVAVAVGGSGGAGSTSSKVTVTNSGIINTFGESSEGILAQSVGGGGGVGGSARTLKNKVGGLDSKSAGTLSVAVGGGGGDGAIAGDVEVRNFGSIVTTNTKSFGIRAQSIGGGGGVGGATVNMERQQAKSVDSLNVLIGGGGGNGQVAGRVDVLNSGYIRTHGLEAYGISANSIGGSGGDAGSVYNLTVIQPQSSGESNVLQVAIGGGGGSGGKGGAVHVVNAPIDELLSGSIFTLGIRSHGIFAQSLGGGGGNGSSVFSLDGSTGAADSIAIGINMGGAGGDGNTGGEVTVENSGHIFTSGEGSFGILAQSIGGSGGNGGVVLSGNILLKSKDKSPLISIGGIGGAGNDGGHVMVTNTGSINTIGKGGHGIVAQSIGGGGGNAGLAVGATADKRTLIGSNLMALLVGAVGGGQAGVGGQVDVVQAGDISVTGVGAQAIIAESINGGGGHAYFNLTGFSPPSLGSALPDVNVPDLGELIGIPNLVKGEPTNKPVDPVIIGARVGANGASSMNAGKVNVTFAGSAYAGGTFGSGATLRSVGGGGGDLILTGDLSNPEPPPPGFFAADMIYVAGLGAKDTTDSSGADIDSQHTGQITTTGVGATGLLLQSIGGGGGSALVDLQVEDSTILDSIRLGLGAVGTSGSNGGNITRTQTGGVITTEDFANGALIQSIGGGGGNAVARVGLLPVQNPASQLVAAAQDTGASGQRTQAIVGAQVVSAASGSAQAPVIVSLGANGGGPNDGGDVNVSFSGGFTTQGNNANALIVQSIGGGGGEVLLSGAGPVTVILGGQGGASGTGGSVTVTNNGAVLTSGTSSNGLLLQSIGGGGGTLFGAGPNPQLTLSSDNSGDGGAITLNQTGNVSVLGDGSNGIIAQSLGGGGGYIDGTYFGTSGGSGSGGTIDLTVNGSVFAPGANSSAILAQSLGSLGAGNISVSATGDVRGGSGTGVGIALDGGANNVVTIGSSLSAVSGMAMTGTTGNDRLENHGLVVGNVILGSGNNVVHNALGASFLTINTLDLRSGAGSTGLFSNDGTLLMGLAADRVPIDLLNGQTFPAPVVPDPKTGLLFGTSVISVVALDGDFVQSPSGLMKYDVAFGPYQGDRINATGSAQVAGKADITLTWLENRHDVTLIATGAGGTDNGLTPIDTLAIDYGIKANPAGIHLTVDSNFALPFLNHNEQQMGHHLDSSLDVGGGSGIGRLMALIGNLRAGQEETYKSIFAELDPESLLTPAVEQIDSARAFGSGILDCQAPDERGAKCGYARIDVHGLQGRSGVTDVDLKTSARLRFGGAVSAGNGWKLGLAGGIDDLGRFAAGPGRMEGNKGLGLHMGLGIAKRFASDQGEARVTIAGGLQSIDTNRNQFIFTRGIGKTTFRTGYIGANAGLDYTLSVGDFFATPALDLQAMRMQIRHFAESGLDGTGARSKGASDWYLSATPKLTAGFRTGGIALSGTIGYQFSNKDQIEAPIQLTGAPDASDPAIIVTPLDKEMLVVGLGVNVKRDENFELQFGFEGLYGDRYTSTTANAKIVLRF